MTAPSVTGGDRGLPRRALLRLALCVPALTAGCGIRLESEAPRLLGTPSPDPAGPAILAERDRVMNVLDALGDPGLTPTPLLRRLRGVFTAHLTAANEALTYLDPPVTAPPAPGRSTAPGRAPTGASDSGSRLLVALREALTSEAANDPPTPPRAAAFVVASRAGRAVAHALLDGPDLGRPHTPLPPDTTERLLAAYRAAAYGLEVAAAHAGAARDPVSAALTQVRAVESHLTTPDAPPRPLGYALPLPVTDATTAARLTDGVLRRLVSVVLAQAPAILPADHPEAQLTLGLLAAEADTARVRCGGPIEPLPGRPRPPSGSPPSATTPTP